MLAFDSLRFAMAVVATVIAVLAVGMLFVQWQETERDQAIAEALTGGRTERAEAAIVAFGCAGCHTIPNIPGADGLVGPKLVDMRKRVFIGGMFRNTGHNLAQWIVDPRSLSPATAMPKTGISIKEARDIAAFLYAH